MKSIRALRLLSLLGFLLLMAPFYDQCNGRGMKKVEAKPEEVMVDTTAVDTPSVKNNAPVLLTKEPIINKDSITEIKVYKTPFYVKAYEFIDDENNENAFELANMSR